MWVVQMRQLHRSWSNYGTACPLSPNPSQILTAMGRGQEMLGESGRVRQAFRVKRVESASPSPCPSLAGPQRPQTVSFRCTLISPGVEWRWGYLTSFEHTPRPLNEKHRGETRSIAQREQNKHGQTYKWHYKKWILLTTAVLMGPACRYFLPFHLFIAKLRFAHFAMKNASSNKKDWSSSQDGQVKGDRFGVWHHYLPNRGPRSVPYAECIVSNFKCSLSVISISLKITSKKRKIMQMIFFWPLEPKRDFAV